MKVHFSNKLVAKFSYIFDSFTLISSRVLVLPKVCRLIYFMKKKIGNFIDKNLHFIIKTTCLCNTSGFESFNLNGCMASSRLALTRLY